MDFEEIDGGKIYAPPPPPPLVTSNRPNWAAQETVMNNSGEEVWHLYL